MKVYIQNLGVYGMIVVAANSLEEAETLMKAQYNYDSRYDIEEFDVSDISEPIVLDVSLGDC